MRSKKKLLIFIVSIVGLLIVSSYSSNIISTNITNNIDNNNRIIGKLPNTSAPPTFDLDSPLNYSLYGKLAPNYSLSKIKTGNFTWYEFLDISVNSTPIELEGTVNENFTGEFDQTMWDSLSNGTATIRFYVNNSLGETSFLDAIVRIDIMNPSIDSIDSPSSGAWFDGSPPSYSLSITEANLDTIWYTLDGGSTNYTGATSGTIDSTAWTNAGEGAVTITFYVNDTVSNWGISSVGVNKDSINPSIDSIDSPSSGAWFSSAPPSYSLSITEANLDSIWYTLDGGLNNYTGAASGTIDSTAWTNAGDGSVTITFYVNDSVSNTDFASVSINKDTTDPSIDSIDSPSTGAWFSSTPPSYSLSITETNLDSIWYTLDGGLNNYTGAMSGTIDSTAWTNAGDGSVTITYYVNDSVGNWDTANVVVNKDSLDPSIDSVDSPLSGEWFDDTPPSYSLSITEVNLDSIWYTLDGGLTNYSGAVSGTIDSTAWSNAPQGLVTITFYVNDSAGNMNSASVGIYKDSVDPSIDSIDSPTSGAWFDGTPPSYSLSITEVNLFSIWYTLDGGLTNYSGAVSGTIDSTAWSNALQGLVTITFYVNDSAGNWASASVGVNKDSIDPSIDSIDTPSSGAWFSSVPPSYSLSITEANLDSIWYTLDGGLTNYSGAVSGTIDSTAWSNAPQGAVTITFYVNDSAENKNFASVGINKDSVDPSIDSIDSPTSGAWFSNTPPSYSLSITEANLDSIWYTLDGGLTNYTGAVSGTVDPTAWSNAPQGLVTITFYVNDSAGNMNSASVGINKDSVDPSIDSIDSPSPGSWFDDTPPSYSLSITEVNLDSIWYTLDGGLTNYTGAVSGTIDSTAWSNAPQGLVTITFYVNDSASNWNSASVGVNKDSIDPSIDSIDTPSSGAWFSSSPPSYSLSITEANLDSIWYTLDGGLTNYSGAVSGTIDSTAWSNAPQGLVTITFYVNDSASNWNSASVGVNKDSIDPSIDSIDSPSSDAWFDDTPPSYSLSITEVNLDSIWYTLDGGLTNYSGAVSGTIDSTAWSNAPQGLVTIMFYVNDSAGNWNSASVGINKDSIDPSIDSIDSPLSGTWINGVPPSYSLSITEANLDSIWYTLDGGLTNYSGAVSGTIDSTAWSNALQGAVTIMFYVNDSAGNWDSASVGVNKDTIAPILILNSPVNNTYVNNPPAFNITAYDNFVTLTYTVIGYSPLGLTNNTESLLNQAIWDDLSQGEFHIVISAFDLLGQSSNLTIVLYKDTLAPSITIHSPVNNTYWNLAPNLNVTAVDPNLDTIWYSVNNVNITLQNSILQQLNNSIWASLQDEGQFEIKIYANDSFGHLNDIYSLILYKDVLIPTLIINSPLNNTYHKLPPILNAVVLDPFFDSLWYQVGAQVVTLVNDTNQQLTSGIWDGLDVEGDFIIYFYANDSAGNLNELFSLNLNKDVRDPVITINSPNPYDLFGVPAPNFDLLINEINLNQTWYMLYNQTWTSSNYTFSGLTGTINQLAWEEFENTNVTIRFYANDTLNNLGYSEITIRKNVIAPIITITGPDDSVPYGIEAPNITIYIAGTDLDTTWYTLDGGLTNFTFTGLSVVLNQAAWDNYGFSDVVITFYVNDSLERIGFDQITLEKDPDPPEVFITFITPSSNNSHYNYEPTFRITVYEPNIDSIWYRVGLTNIAVINDTVIVLNDTIWNGLPQGKFTIEVFAEDILGYLNDSITLTFYKDTLAPSLVINQPYDGNYYNSPPPINITVYDPNFLAFSLTYTVIGYLPDAISLTNNTEELLNLAIWNSLPQGAFSISITARDTFNQRNDTFVLSLYKDTIGPIFDSLIPSNFTVYNSTPGLRISYIDPRLDTIYYKVGTSSIITIPDNTLQDFDLSIWSSLNNGPFTIEFYANDTFGHTSTVVNLTLIKDTILPQITVNSPINGTYYSSPPIMDITVSDLNPESIWYTVMGTKILLSGVAPFDSSIWDSLGQGEFLVYVFANDSAGNLNDTLVLTLLKDTLPPLVTVNLPLNNTYWNSPDAITINVEAFDPNLNTIYYYVADGYGPALETGNDTTLIWLLWNRLEEGPFTMQIFASDTFGQTNSSIILTLYKDTIDPYIDILSPQPNDLIGETTPFVSLNVTDTNLEEIWYQLNNGSVVTPYYPWTGSIEQAVWDQVGNGTVTIRFYANDTATNARYEEVIVRKNIYAPIISINYLDNHSPYDTGLFGNISPDFEIYKSGSDLQSTWYTIDYGITNFTFTGPSGSINQSAWDAIPSIEYGSITLTFYINDSLGKIGFDEIIIRKDPDIPTVVVNSPADLTPFASSPLLDLTVTDSNLHKVWYSVNGETRDITNNLTILLDASIWSSLSDGSFTIEFFANDTIGNLNNLIQLDLSKDTTGPTIEVIRPTPNQRVGRTAPYIEVLLSDINGVHSSWYRIIGYSNRTLFAGPIDRIDVSLWENLWDSLPQDSVVTIRFGSNDTLGNRDFTDVDLIINKPIAPPNILLYPFVFLIPLVGLVALVPFSVKLTKTRYYKSLNNKDRKKLRNALITAGFFMSLLTVFFIL